MMKHKNQREGILFFVFGFFYGVDCLGSASLMMQKPETSSPSLRNALSSSVAPAGKAHEVQPSSAYNSLGKEEFLMPQEAEEQNDDDHDENDDHHSDSSTEHTLIDHDEAKISSQKSSSSQIDKDVMSLTPVDHSIKKVDEELSPEYSESLSQPEFYIDNNHNIAFNFENTDLSKIVDYMQKIHSITFLTEDIISGAPGAKGVTGHKVTFRTNKPISKKESWDLFITFLYMAGFDLIPLSHDGYYKIVPFGKVAGEIVPTYIGVDYHSLPDNEMVIRYIYFVKNLDPAKLQNILKNLQAGSAKLDVYNELKAMIFLDRSSNIKSLMQIVNELDQSVLPESLSVVKIKRANVADVVSLYKSLKAGTTSGTATTTAAVKSWVARRQDSTSEYFPQDVVMISDLRTNSLILLGSARSIQRIESFVTEYLDAPLDLPTIPVFTYRLEYTNAADIVASVTALIQYGAETPAGQYGGVRNGVKYFSPSSITIVAEPHSNSVIINASKEDRESIVALIKELDQPSKQIGLEVLIVTITDSEARTLGVQLSGPKGPNAASATNIMAQTFAQNISGQTSGILGTGGQATAPVVTSTTGANGDTGYSLKSSLAPLLGATYNGVVNEAGAILVTFGQPIWALFKALQSMVSAHVVANPFLIASNNTAAEISIGEVRRIMASQIVSAYGTTTSGLTNMQANLTVNITPQINKDNIVNLQIMIQNNQFILAGSTTSALQDQKTISTNASVGNGEVLVLAGLMQEQYSSTSRGVPFLEHIPIFGWLFKSKVKSVARNHFLVFISPHLIEQPEEKRGGIDHYTLYKMEEAQKNINIIDEMDWFASKRDPIQKAFFGDASPKNLKELSGQAAGLDSKRIDRERQQKRVRERSSLKNRPYKKGKTIREHALSERSHDLIDNYVVHQKQSSLPIQNSISNSFAKGVVHV